jgi:hypothetical protein
MFIGDDRVGIDIQDVPDIHRVVLDVSRLQLIHCGEHILQSLPTPLPTQSAMALHQNAVSPHHTVVEI